MSEKFLVVPANQYYFGSLKSAEEERLHREIENPGHEFRTIRVKKYLRGAQRFARMYNLLKSIARDGLTPANQNQAIKILQEIDEGKRGANRARLTDHIDRYVPEFEPRVD